MSTPPQRPGFRSSIRHKYNSGKGTVKQLFNKSRSAPINEEESTQVLNPPSYSVDTDSSSELFEFDDLQPPPDTTEFISSSYPILAIPDKSPSIIVSPVQENSERVQTTTGLPVPTSPQGVYTAIVSPRGIKPTAGNSSDILVSGYEGLKTILRSIERASDVFPPLKSAVGGFLSIVDVVEATSRNEKDRDDLQSMLQTFLTIINQHTSSNQSNPSSDTFTRRIEGLSIAINNQITDIRMKKKRGRARRTAEVSRDASEIAGVYRTLLYLFQAFTIDTTLSTEEIAQQILAHTLLDKLCPVSSAEYNAFSPTKRHGCTEKTRISILARLVSWATDPTDTKIYWLNGMAGTGKTTISYSFSEILDKNQMLGASFFCSRLDTTTGSVDRILPTIAHQLALRFPSVYKSLLLIIKRDHGIATKSLPIQFRDLVVAPLHTASKTFKKKPLVIAIEGLDECSDQDEVNRLLEVISQYSSTLPVKFFITSRPEKHIRRGFNNRNFDKHSRFILHDVEKDVVKADIELFARGRLVEITEGRSDCDELLDEWPPEHELKILVELAGNLFIYAATACAYVAGGGNIRKRLSLVTNISQKPTGSATAKLDALYNSIVNAAYEDVDTEEQEDIKLILRAVVNVQKPLSILSLGTLLSIPPKCVQSALSSLHSVIHVPSSGNLDDPISMLHASFSDYITAQNRAGKNYLERSKSHYIIALRCLELIDSSLQENIFQLTGQPHNSNIRPEMMKERISDGLAYACIYWAFHASETSIDNVVSPDLHSRLLHFFGHNVLRWIECLSVIGQLGTVILFLRKLEGRLQTDGDLWNAVMDTRRTITESFEIISKYSLETYSSALAWLPEQSCIRKRYHDKSPWKVIVGRRTEWNACEAVLVGHKRSVLSVAFSPDGSRIVSGCYDGTIRIWNAATGECEAELLGHTARVWSVAFSPDCERIASGSEDGTLRVWNAVTGECQTKLERDAGGINSVAFSPDGSRVASGSDDGSICIWSTSKGIFKATDAHSNRVLAVAFSADGNYIVSGSEDKFVRIWDGDTGDCTMEIGGHSAAVRSVSFFPDGARITSASEDGKICIWTIVTGECEAILEGHKGEVYSVALSANGSRVVSGSDDKSIRIWDTITNESEAIWEGHSSAVYSVAFSPDGSRVVSGSSDNSVRIWNSAAMGESEVNRAGHNDTVDSIAFSPDGKYVASGSDDNIIRLWNTSTGACEATMIGHSGGVNSVAISPDGKLLLSGSDDNTARIWNTATGKSKVLMKGHKAGLLSVAFSPDVGHVVSGSSDRTVRIWNATGKCEVILEGHSFSVFAVAFSPDGSLVASGSSDIRLWNVRTGESVAVLKGHSHVLSVAFSPQGDYFISRSYDKTVRVWNVTLQKYEVALVERDWTVEIVLLPRKPSSIMTSAQRAVTPDGTTICWDSEELVIIPSQLTSSLYYDGEYIRCREIDQWCWIPPQFRNPWKINFHKSRIVLRYKSGGLVVLEYDPYHDS